MDRRVALLTLEFDSTNKPSSLTESASPSTALGHSFAVDSPSRVKSDRHQPEVRESGLDQLRRCRSVNRVKDRLVALRRTQQDLAMACGHGNGETARTLQLEVGGPMPRVGEEGTRKRPGDCSARIGPREQSRHSQHRNNRCYEPSSTHPGPSPFSAYLEIGGSSFRYSADIICRQELSCDANPKSRTDRLRPR